ncbi:CPBP family intramembrane glutamic endopeptidase [Spirosoma sordidisoli]
MVRSIVLGLRGSLLEEIIYRGFLQKKLMSYSYRLNSIIVSSLVFSTSHLIGIQSFTEGLWTFVDVFLFSVVVGTIFIKYNSFVYSFAFHWIWNLFISMHWVYGDCNLPKKDYLFRTYIYCDNYLSNFEFLKQAPITYILTSFAFLFILNKNLRACLKIEKV